MVTENSAKELKCDEQASGLLSCFFETPSGKRFMTKIVEVFGSSEKLNKKNSIPENQMELVYAAAYNCYNTERCEDAMLMFKKLFLLNQSELKYLKGLAASCLKAGEYEMAIQNYGLCNILDHGNPAYAYFAGYCHMKLSNWGTAKTCFDLSIQQCGDNEEFDDFKERSRAFIKKLKDKDDLLFEENRC